MADTNLGEATVNIRAKFDEFDSDMSRISKKFESFVAGIAKSAGVAIGAAFVGAGVAVAKFTTDSIKEFTAFQGGLNEVFTLLPGMTQDSMDKMSQDVLDFSKKLGVLPEEVIPALYQAISAGVPPDNVFDFLETAQKAAVGGVTDLAVSVDGISSVVNAYGKDVISASEASDLMFTAVKDGKTTFDELSKSLFQVIPTASSLGIDFGDITAALASMTAQGVPTSVATTQLRQLLVELSKEGGEAAKKFEDIAGKSFPDFIAAGGDVQGALQLMEEYANDSGKSISNLFGSVEAANAALALTGGGTETFTKNLTDMENSAGATTAAFDTMDSGIGRSQERAAALWSTIKIGTGQALEPLLNKLVELAEQALPKIEEAFAIAGPIIEEFATEFSEKLGPALEIIFTNLRSISDAMGITNDEMSDGDAFAAALTKTLGLLTTALEVIAIISEGVAYIWENWGEAIKQLLNPLGTLLKNIGDLDQKLKDLSVSLPDWMTPGSPTPLQIGIEGINSALNNIPDFSSKFDITPSFGGLSSGGNGGGINNSTTVNVGSVSATSISGNPADEAIRMTVQLLRQQLQAA